LQGGLVNLIKLLQSDHRSGCFRGDGFNYVELAR
jgi:hypothetical protein